MMKLKREPLSSETRASRMGAGPITGDDLFLGGAGRDGDVGAGLALDFAENLGQAGVVGADAQASTVVLDFHLRDRLVGGGV